MNARHVASPRTRAVLGLAALLTLLVAGAAVPASAQGSELGICIDVANDADGDGSFTADETSTTGADVTHRVTIEDCGDWDVVIASVVATTADGDEAVCASLEGTTLRVDETTSCEFILPAPDDTMMTAVTVTVMDANGDLGAAQASGETIVQRGAATASPTATPSPTATATEDPTDEPTEDPTDEPTEDDSEDAAVADDELADTGVGSWALFAWGLLLVLAGATVHDAGRRAHVLQPAVAVHARYRGEHNPLLAGAMAITRQVRWALQDWRA